MKTSKHHGLPALLLLAAIGFASNASAALFSRTIGTDEMVYDCALDITWLKNANTNGLMNWDAAQAWANNLVYGGYDDWRLPTSLNGDGSGSCFGLNCTGSEMGHLFYGDINNGLGGRAGYSITTTHNANFDLFSNLQSY